jgi:hypothetical protein
MAEPADFPAELRSAARKMPGAYPYTSECLKRAASEIERLRADNAVMLDGLKAAKRALSSAREPRESGVAQEIDDAIKLAERAP